jgi:multiple sugar transport system substrate-binding protein
MRTYRTACAAITAIISTCLVLTACAGQQSSSSARDTTCVGTIQGPKPAYVTVWYHTGTSAEERTLNQQVAAFNAAQHQVKVELTDIPQAEYASVVSSAAAAGTLPDILDFDGPYLYNYAWTGKLKPLNSCLSERLRGDLLPSIIQQGTYAGKLWGIGTIDSGLGLFVRPSILRRIGVRIPDGVGDAWTASEFTQILQRLQRAGYRQPLDMQINAPAAAGGTNPEWFTYGFAPIVWSAGGDLINRSTYRTAQGTLNSPASVRALTIMQGWFHDGLVIPDTSGTAFVSGQAPISWVGHWLYGTYHQAFPRDLAIVPLPRFGQLPSSCLGSWQWGITANATSGDAAWQFLSYLLQPAQELELTRADGAIPATLDAIRQSPNFAPGGPEHLYVQQLEDGVARARPQTPAYPVITAAFSSAILNIARGSDVQQTLDTAVRQIDGNLAANGFYKSSEP